MDTILGTAKKEGKGLEFAKDLGRKNATDLTRMPPAFIMRLIRRINRME
jgi:hypothetical protein